MLTFLTRNLENPDTEAILLLHAFPLSAEMWIHQLDALSKRANKVIAPNVYGVGGSTQKENYTFSDYADSLHDLLIEQKIDSVSIVGISMGGYQAFAFYKKYPEFVKSLVLSDTRADSDSDEAKKNRLGFIDAVIKNGSDEAVSRMISKFFAKETYTTNENVVDRTTSIIQNSSSEAIINQLRALANREDSTSMLSQIKVPATIIVGEEDALTPIDLAKVLHHGIPNSNLEIIPKSGHLPNLEQPEIFNRILFSHLSKH